MTTKAPLGLVLAQTERDVPLKYTVSLSTLQHPDNSVNNRPKGATSPLEIYVMVVTAVAAAAATSFDELVHTVTNSCGYSPALKRGRKFGEDGCAVLHRAVLPIEPLSNSTGAWAAASHTFAADTRCEACTVVVRISPAGGWVSYWGSLVYVTGLRIDRAQVAVPARTFVNGSCEVVTLRPPPPPPPGPAAPKEGCPHASAGLLAWGAPSTWPGGAVPTPGGGPGKVVTLPEGARVLLSGSGGSSAAAPFGLIVVPASSALVLDDAAIELHVHEIRVHGHLLGGAAACRLEGPVRMVFHGTRAGTLAGADPAAPPLSVAGAPSKGLVVDGGQADLHGRLFTPSWTRLSSTAFAGDAWLHLAPAAPVGGPRNPSHGWLVGMEVFVTTTVYDDRAGSQPQNERRRIAEVAADGLSVRLDAALKFRHHAGPEYQAEVSVLAAHTACQSVATNHPLCQHCTPCSHWRGGVTTNNTVFVSTCRVCRRRPLSCPGGAADQVGGARRVGGRVGPR